MAVTASSRHNPAMRPSALDPLFADASYITLVFFNARGDYLEKLLPVGQKRVISGKVEWFEHALQMPHPDYIALPKDLEKIRRLEPVYPLTQGISLKMFGKILEAAEKNMPDLPEWIEPEFMHMKKWQSWKQALLSLHTPKTEEDLLPANLARARLAYDELLANQLALALSRGHVKKSSGTSIKGNGVLTNALIRALPFTLTAGQQTAVKEIVEDMGAPTRMIRLLQGDVGSGKTVVALMAMLTAVEAGKQAALMAPTDLLCRQHLKTLTHMVMAAGLTDRVNIVLLTGKEKGKTREAILDKLRNGKIQILVGTHALFQEEVGFREVSLVVIDEQHRFGVKQRLALTEKGSKTDVLLMTATPIPRTLTLTFYGDMEVSLLKEKPPGRTPIDTRTVPASRMEEVVERLEHALQEGSKAYWVCPLVEESEKSDLAAATDRFEYFRKRLGDTVGLIHGRMKQAEKDETMLAFLEGRIQLLVATTVIEVGVDVPDATIMVIEHAERFGLAQLHQLRGRVGRGKDHSACVLLYGEPISETGKRRLAVMRETEDGFRIAEEDLMLRGSGEVLGTRQSGMPLFRVAQFPEHGELLLAARDDAKLILHRDSALATARGLALRNLLYLFEYDTQIQYLKSG
ncbi:MAG: ATP-dependent DNA helicase RecG [Proteobacteria bacterium]|nr:ATP-dependent DNA helicase RecG [Pseudomonadota bacterium]